MTEDDVATPGSDADPDTDPSTVEDLLWRVLERPKEEQQAALDAACTGRSDLAARLRDLYDMVSIVDREAAPAKQLPERIGPYEILELRGEGGMGTVYVAEQTGPIRRRVAIKVVKLGMSSREILARFALERRALATMNHRCIARVFAADATEDGQPYFVMELVEGLPLNRYCDDHKLDVPARIELFREVCAGVQHAHQKGIIHRDLKPGNILVAREDDRPVPKILDFGLAKATNQELVARSFFTERDRILGTPEYMAPEQARMDEEAIDTRADIYSLGVILYELLSGELPFSTAELRGRGWAAMQRILTEQEPPKPSTRLGSSSQDVAQAARNRCESQASLVKSLRGDLDWIVLKALAKEPERRYDSATSLSTDLKRYLELEPVSAGPPSTSYRVFKLLRRYRGQFTAAGLVLLSLVAGIVGIWFYAEESATNAAAASRTAQHLQEKVDEFNLLAGVVRLRRARDEEQGLYPAWPAHAAQMREWVARYADPLVAARPKLMRVVGQIRSGALEWTPEQKKRDRESHPSRPRVATLRRRQAQLRRLLVSLQGESPEKKLKAKQNFALIESDTSLARFTEEMLEERLAALEAEISALEQQMETRRTFAFTDERDTFLHETMAQLIQDIDEFDRSVAAGVRERLVWAGRLAELAETHKGRWVEARAGVAKSPRYQGVRIDLRPQPGLVPIGENPATGLWEFYHLRSAADPSTIPAHGPGGSIEVTPETGIVFVLIPGGHSMMGAQSESRDRTNYDPGAAVDEQPVHRVELRPFFLARHEMTQGQWKRLSGGDEPSLLKAGWLGDKQQLFETNPVEQVSWVRCTSLLREHGLVLPTESQWEYACRAGTSTPWSTGAERGSLSKTANVADKSAKAFGIKETENWEDGFIVHSPVGSLAPNGFGLHDMHGNLAEWCADSAMSYVSPGREGDGLRRSPGDAKNVITRGGSFMLPAVAARAAARHGAMPDSKLVHTGLRAARGLPQ